jgi:two-component system sensor histidine kinase DegS
MSQLREAMRGRSFWILAIMLVALGLVHYLTPQVRALPLTPYGLDRHAVERIIFLLPVAGASFAFGQVGGLVVLALAVFIMLPRVFLISPYPADALVEVLGVGVVGYLVVWMIEVQEREKRLRQEAASRLRMINAVTSIVTGSLELEQVLGAALEKVLEVTRVKMASVFLLDQETGDLVLTAHRGESFDAAQDSAGLDMGDSPVGQAWRSGEPVVLDNLAGGLSPAAGHSNTESVRSFLAVPLKSSDRVLGVMTLGDSQPKRFAPPDVQLMASIGGQVGVAIENARFYENMRFYARQVTRAQEEERMRIARDLHDETIQMLIVMSRRIEALATFSDRVPAAVMGLLVELQGTVSDALKGLRRFIQDLRPSTLDYLGLMAAVVGSVNDLNELDAITAEVKAEGTVRRLSPVQELGLFRVFQEAVSNIRRHSECTHVLVEVSFRPSSVRMCISDNGRGFNVPERIDGLVSSGKLGLIGMHERAQILGGTLTIEARPGGGTKIIVEVPTQSDQVHGQPAQPLSGATAG